MKEENNITDLNYLFDQMDLILIQASIDMYHKRTGQNFPPNNNTENEIYEVYDEVFKTKTYSTGSLELVINNIINDIEDWNGILFALKYLDNISRKIYTASIKQNPFNCVGNTGKITGASTTLKTIRFELLSKLTADLVNIYNYDVCSIYSGKNIQLKPNKRECTTSSLSDKYVRLIHSTGGSETLLSIPVDIYASPTDFHSTLQYPIYTHVVDALTDTTKGSMFIEKLVLALLCNDING